MRESKAYGIVLIGKYSLMKEGIARVLLEKNFRILSSASYEEQLASKLRAQRLMFLIAHTSDDFDLAVAEIELVKDQHPDVPIAVVTDHYEPNEPALAFKAGASGYLANVISCDSFVKSIELVMLGETVFPPTFPSSTSSVKKNRRPKAVPVPVDDEPVLPCSPPESAGAPLLSPREMAILRCLIEGDANKSIARKIDIAEATVKVHVKAILRKIRVQNRTQAAIWGMNNALQLQPANNNSQFSSADADKTLLKSAVSVYQV
ncbi:LuxR C-terminal-related transcriptional regulator [Bosea sp. RAF48]|uniref:LuxR C-terminal-related transcriptional regulator n=1 Tax=Bosea sp. RAF48 TaxID=3237480 RepID=UPI003F915B27